MDKKGLVNSEIGIFRDIVYSRDFFPKNDYRHKWIPISPLVCYNQSLYGSRTNNLFRLAYALTVNKSQGQTLDKIVVDLGKKETSYIFRIIAGQK